MAFWDPARSSIRRHVFFYLALSFLRALAIGGGLSSFPRGYEASIPRSCLTVSRTDRNHPPRDLFFPPFSTKHAPCRAVIILGRAAECFRCGLSLTPARPFCSPIRITP